MPRGADRVTHVVQSVEQADQVVALTGEVLRRGHLEPRSPVDAASARLPGASIEGSWMSKPTTLELSNAFAMSTEAREAAAHIGHARPESELLDHPVESRQPSVTR